MMRTVLVAIGGMIGSVGRYWIGGFVQDLSGTALPLGTLAVNGIGSFVIAIVMALSIERGVIGAETRLFLTVGICGGFTTMSTFSYETFSLLRDGQWVLAVGNIGVTLGGTLLAVWVGQTLGRLM